MNGWTLRIVGVAVLAVSICADTAEHNAVQAAESTPVSFAATVKPLLARRCFACHGPDVESGGLRLHTHEAALAELDSGGRAIVPKNCWRA
jgi:hypothetical protein